MSYNFDVSIVFRTVQSKQSDQLCVLYGRSRANLGSSRKAECMVRYEQRSNVDPVTAGVSNILPTAPYDFHAVLQRNIT